MLQLAKLRNTCNVILIKAILSAASDYDEDDVCFYDDCNDNWDASNREVK